MNREDITKLAREAGFVGMDGDHGALRRFAALVAAAERERIAKEWDECSDSDFDDIDIGATIRARGQA